MSEHCVVFRERDAINIFENGVAASFGLAAEIASGAFTLYRGVLLVAFPRLLFPLLSILL
jgi:hypothetical protein